MIKMNKVSMIASIAGKFAYVATSVMLLTKSIGKKAYNRINYSTKWTIEIVSTDNGLVLIENRKKTLPEIVEIAKSLEDANVRIVMERSK